VTTYSLGFTACSRLARGRSSWSWIRYLPNDAEVRSALGVALIAMPALSVAPAIAQKPAAAKPAAKATVKLEDKYATSEDGTKIHYVASGSGPLVVLIHGFPDFSGSWTKLTPKLSPNNSRTANEERGRHARTVSIPGMTAIRTLDANTRSILEGLEWLGLRWDEGPYFQSKGYDSHKAAAQRLAR